MLIQPIPIATPLSSAFPVDVAGWVVSVLGLVIAAVWLASLYR